MNEYTVYLHISPNGKRYYGITMQDVNRRWQNGNGYRNNKHFANAIQKYGWDNFQHIIVARELSEEEAKWLEIELIKEFDTTNRDKGYNISLGGESSNGYHHTEETRKKMRENHWDCSGENNPKYWEGKHRSEETKKKMSENNARYWKGKQFSDETKKKMSENHWDNRGKNHPMYGKYGKNHPRAKAVICITTGKIFDTAVEGAECYNCNRCHISSCCKGKRKSAGKLNGIKLVWRYLNWNHNKTYRINK